MQLNRDKQSTGAKQLNQVHEEEGMEESMGQERGRKREKIYKLIRPVRNSPLMYGKLEKKMWPYIFSCFFMIYII